MGLYIWPTFSAIRVLRELRFRFIAKGKHSNTMVLPPLSYAAIVGSGNKAAPPIFPTPTPMKQSPTRSINSGVQSISSPRGPTRDRAAALPLLSQTLEIQQDRPQIAFLSGHIDITASQFTQNYATPLDAAIAQGDNFIMSNAGGADTMGLAYLDSHDVSPDRITIYLHTPQPNRRLNATQTRINSLRLRRGVEEAYKKKGYKCKVVQGFHTERDAVMTEESDYDILWMRSDEDTRKLYGAKYREGRISGTQKNMDRRALKEKRIRSHPVK